MTNDEIIKELPNLKKYEARQREIRQLLRDLDKEQRALDSKLDELYRVDFIHNGVAIHQGCSEEDFCQAGQDCRRSADFYRNAHGNKTWGVHVKADGDSTDRLVGFFATRERAREVCLEFVTGSMTSDVFVRQMAKETL